MSQNKFINPLLTKPDTKIYKRMETKLARAGFINIKPETFQLICLLTPVIVFIGLVAIRATNIINSLMNKDKIQKITEITGNVIEINTDLMIPVLFIISLLFYFAPFVVLKFITVIRNTKGEKEVMMLHTYAIMMLRSRQNVKQVLRSLYERASIYKKPLEIAVNNYSKNPTKALEELKVNAGHPQFEKISLGLAQALDMDKTTSLRYLENHRNLARELSKIELKKKNTKKSIFGVLLLFFPLFAAGAVVGYPWFIFAMQQLTDVPM